MTAEARPDESIHGKVMHAAIQSGDREAIARYRNAFPILEPFSDAGHSRRCDATQLFHRPCPGTWF